MNPNYDVIIVGLGAMGSATAYHLARRGVKVLGIDRFGVPNNMGSSSGDFRAIRSSYYEHPDYVPLLETAYQNWRDIESESGLSIIQLTGGLYIGSSESELVAGSLRAACEHKLPHELLSHRDLSLRYPQFTLPDNYIALYEEGAGIIRPQIAISAFAESARNHGAVLHTNEKILEWASSDSGMRLITDQHEYFADRIVFCAGPWTDSLLADLGVPLIVTRQVTGWVQPARPELFGKEMFPTWALDHREGEIYYGFPILSNMQAMKVANHTRGAITDADQVNRHTSSADEESYLPMLRTVLPDAMGSVVETNVCMYTNSTDSHFIIDSHPLFENVFLACGFSGHGFKFASVVGEVLADLATDGRTNLPIEFLRLSRFD